MIATPGQTVGPFFGFALPYDGGPSLVAASHPAAVQLTGIVYDGAGTPVPDALLEIWQADPSGAYVQQAGSLHRDAFAFTGWGRAGTDNTGRYAFTTLRPGTSFIAMAVFARGLQNRLFTRVYLPGAAEDALLSSLPQDRRRTLFAVEDGRRLLFDVRLQGADETVFLAYE